MVNTYDAKNKKYSGEWFRSTDPWVMSPVRFHCATPLTVIGPKYNVPYKLNLNQKYKIIRKNQNIV